MIKNKQVQIKLSIIVPHELLEAIVHPGNEAEYCSIGPKQEQLHEDLVDLGKRLSIDTTASLWGICALWGDSGAYTHKDSLYLLVMTMLSGIHRTRFWLVAFSKRHLCRCGCYGRCTLDRIFEVLAWSFRCFVQKIHPCVGSFGDVFTKKDGNRFNMRGRSMRFG